MSTRSCQVADRSVIRRVIDCDVIVRLKETHLANLLSAHSRCSDVCHRADREFQARVCRINPISNNRNADRVKRSYFDVFPDQPLHDVEIVNHQVEHDVDVQRTRGELAHAMNFKIDGTLDVWPERDQRRIEAFGVADLQYRAAFPARSDHAIRFFQSARDWFLNQHVYAGFEQAASYLAMRFGRNSQTDGVNSADQRVPISRRIRAPFRGGAARARFVEIA